MSARQAIRGGLTSRNRKRKKYAICSTEVAAIVSICVAAHHNACVVLSSERPGSAAGIYRAKHSEVKIVGASPSSQ